MNETATAYNNDVVDLTQWDDAYANAPVEDRSSESVPDGKYQVNVEEVAFGYSQAGNQLLKWKLKVLNGPYEGRLIFRNNMMMSADNIKHLKQDLHVAGIDSTRRLSELKLEDLLDVKLQVQVKSKDGNTNVYVNSRITGVDADPGPGDADALGAF